MTTETGNQSAESVRRSSTDCKPLLDAATRELFQNNAFRITGLSVDATSREIAKHAHKLTVLHGLGIADATAFPLKIPPTLDQIREAFEKLNKFPEQRMVDEFFWFWPREFGEAALDPAIQALAAGKGETASQIWTSAENNPIEGVVAKHNLAVLSHLRALDLENNGIAGEFDAKRLGEIWRNALKRWEVLIPDDALWEKVSARIRQIGDPGLTTGFARRMRAALPTALNKVNAELALTSAKAGRMDLAKVHVEVMRETNQGLDSLTRAAELVLAPTIARVREHIKRANQQTASNPETGDQVARDLITEAVPLVEIFAWFFGEAEHPAQDSLEEVTTTCINSLVDYQKKTGGNKTFVELLERTLPLTKSNKLRALIQKNIGIGRKNLLHELFQLIHASTALPSERLKQFHREAAQPLQTTAASLDSNAEARNALMDDAALVLCNIAVEAWNKFQDKPTAITANGLALRYVYDQELKKKLNENGEIYSRVPARPPVKKSSKGAGVGCWIAIALWVLFSIISSCHPRRESSSNSSYKPSGAATVSIHQPSLSGAANPTSKTNTQLRAV